MNITENKFESKVYKRSRKMYVGQCTLDYFVTLLVADAYLAKLMTNIGISDSTAGIISSCVSFAFLFQLFSIFLARKIKNTKKTVITFHTVSQAAYFALYLVPFTPFSTEVKTWIIAGGIMFGYISRYLVESILFKWANSFVEPSKRGIFSANKEMVSLITGILFTLALGWIIDKYEAVGNITGGFIFISISIFILTVLNFLALVGIKNDTDEKTEENYVPIKEVVKNTLGNKNYLNIVLLMIMWDIARYLTIGFLGTFKTKDLLLTVGTVQVINMIANLGRFFISKPFGRYSDKHSYASGIKLAFIIAAVGFFANIFTTQSTWWCIIIYSIMYNVSMAGSNQNLSNITYSYVKAEHFVAAMAIKNSIGGLFGFGASLVGSRILAYVQANGNTFMGIPMYGQQLLSAISFIIILISIAFIHFVIEKQKVMLQ